MIKVHYTYIVNNRETGEFYIGSRSCNCKSEEDIKYMGSMVAWKPNKNDLIKTILNNKFLTREEAIKEEIQLIKENINNPLNKNYNIPGLGFHNTGRVFEKSVRDKMRLARLGDKNPRYGNPHSEETKEKIRIKAKGRIYSEETRKRLSDARIKKPVLQFDKDMNFIKEYESIKVAGENTKTDKGDISKVCNNKQKSAGGWIWKLK
jgi:hypothetical protein